MSDSTGMDAAGGWIDALHARHAASLTTRELARACRALSARYVEKRGTLTERTPLDSAGKRAAFAVYYAPLHFLTTREIVRALGARRDALDVVVDLGCGTGAASAAWALELDQPPRLDGQDTTGWAVDEAAWTWRYFRLAGRARRADLVAAAERLLDRPGRRTVAGTGLLAAWSVNELADAAQRRLRTALLELGARGASVLVVEPIARAVAPWWPAWAEQVAAAGGRADEWKFTVSLPGRLAGLGEAAGFRQAQLSARSLWLSPSMRDRRPRHPGGVYH
jgi:hypothetical protein